MYITGIFFLFLQFSKFHVILRKSNDPIQKIYSKVLINQLDRVDRISRKNSPSLLTNISFSKLHFSLVLIYVDFCVVIFYLKKKKKTLIPRKHTYLFLQLIHH